MQTKTLPLLEAKAEDANGTGSIAGYGSVFDGIDSYGDTIIKGAYADSLPDFLRTGFIAHGHDWNDYVATVKSAREDERGLYIVGEYHSDPEAQKVRTRVAERLARGQQMGLSIGYEAVEWETRQVETPYRGMGGKFTDKVRALTKINLYEVSLVTVPADAAAQVLSAKTGHAIPHDLPYEDHSDAVRVAVEEWVERSLAGSALRTKAGRPISEARRTRMAGVSGSLRQAVDEIEALLKETEPPPKAEEAVEETPQESTVPVLVAGIDLRALKASLAAYSAYYGAPR